MIGIKGYQKGHTTCLETRNKIGDALRTSFYVPCAYCKNSVLTKPSHFRKNKRIYCSRKCYSKYRSEIMTPEEQNSFGSGYSDDERKKRMMARRMFHHYFRDHHLQKQSCEICGAVAEAHHDDYSKPLQVRWLCFKHHRELHKLHDNPEFLKQEDL
jgi:hypothetical protein